MGPACVTTPFSNVNRETKDSVVPCSKTLPHSESPFLRRTFYCYFSAETMVFRSTTHTLYPAGLSFLLFTIQDKSWLWKHIDRTQNFVTCMWLSSIRSWFFSLRLGNESRKRRALLSQCFIAVSSKILPKSIKIFSSSTALCLFILG